VQATLTARGAPGRTLLQGARTWTIGHCLWAVAAASADYYYFVFDAAEAVASSSTE